MHDINQGYEQDRAQVENILWQGGALRAKYLQGNFWTACGMIGVALLFLVAAVVVPP
jgi:hypothetical protein